MVPDVANTTINSGYSTSSKMWMKSLRCEIEYGYVWFPLWVYRFTIDFSLWDPIKVRSHTKSVVSSMSHPSEPGLSGAPQGAPCDIAP